MTNKTLTTENFDVFDLRQNSFLPFLTVFRLVLDLPSGVWLDKVKFIYVSNEKGGVELRLLNGHKFKVEMRVKNETNWVCVDNACKGTSRCSARLQTDTNGRIKFGKIKHNHEPKEINLNE